MTKKQKKLLQRITAAAVLFAAGMLLPLFAEVPAYIIFALFGISYIIIGWDIIWKAFCNIRQGEAFDENFLMTVATTGAFALGEYSEGVAVMLFYQIGELFQSWCRLTPMKLLSAKLLPLNRASACLSTAKSSAGTARLIPPPLQANRCRARLRKAWKLSAAALTRPAF